MNRTSEEQSMEQSAASVPEKTVEGAGIFKAMNSIIRDLPAVPKSKKSQSGNDRYTYQYRGIDDIYNVLKPIMASHGVFMLPRVLEKTSEFRKTKNSECEVVSVRMEYTFVHEDGSKISCISLGQAMDSGDKAISKAMSAAHKYALMQTFCIPTEDIDDPDASNEQVGAPVPQKDPKKEALNEIFSILGPQCNNSKDEILKQITGFLGREIRNSGDMTLEETIGFLDVIKKEVK